MTQKTKYIILIVSAALVIIVAIILILVFGKKKTSTEETLIESEEVSTEYTTLPIAENVFPSQDSTSFQFDSDSSEIVHNDNSYYTGDLKAPLPNFIYSPSGNYAVGGFFKIEDDRSYYYLLSENDNPILLNENIDAVATVSDGGTLVYYIDGEIAQGNFDRSNEEVLVSADDVGTMYIAFAPLSANELLYWGLPTQPDGSYMNILNLSTKEITPLISDYTVTGASLAPNKDTLLVDRYIDDENSTWLFSINEEQFTRELPIYIDADSAAWSKNSELIAFWNGSSVSIININTDKVNTVATYSESDEEYGGQLSFDDNTIYIYPTE